jgi:hypothetical protein
MFSGLEVTEIVLRLGASCVGLVCIGMGYRLFVRGVQKGGAAITMNSKTGALSMDRGGPGLIFALLGALIVIVGLHDQVGGKKGPPFSEPQPIPTNSGSTTEAPGKASTSTTDVQRADPPRLP